jgi:hypothetical protein
LEASSIVFPAEDLPFGCCFVALSSVFQEVEVEVLASEQMKAAAMQGSIIASISDKQPLGGK